VKDVADFGWAASPLGDLVDILDRLRKPITKRDRKAGPYPYYGATGILDHVDGYLFDEPLVLIGEDGAKWEPGANSAFAIDGKTWVNNHAHVIRPLREKVLDGWLIYYLNGADLMPFISGMTVPKLNQGRLREIPIPLPPLEEQQRIVAVLDEAFEGLARARVHAEANLQNARELFESYAGSVFRPHDDPEESAYSTMVGAVCDIQSGAGFPLQYQGEKNGDFPFYKVSDMNLPGNEWELHSANHYVSDKVRLELRARIFPQDSIVFPKVGGAIATNKKRIIQVAGCVDNNVMGLIPDQAKVVPEYLHEWLRAFDIYEFSNKANPPSITQGTVFGWPLRVPSRDEQMQVVATAVELREHTETLRKSYEDRMQDLDDLRQSLLQKAFAGKLT